MRGLVAILMPALVFLLLPLVGNRVYANNTVTNVTVPANNPWTDTGLTFPQGHVVVIKYIGSNISISYAKQPLSPLGIPSCIAGATFVAPGLPCYSLIGRIDGNPPFPLGTETNVEFTTATGGRLFLGVNDETLLFDDNVGGWNLDLLYPAVPAPHPTPIPSVTPTPIPIQSKTPLIFIPGIGGSELKTSEVVNWSAPDGHGGIFTNTYPAGEKVWVNEGEAAKPGNDDYFDVLRMQSDGQTSEANIELTGNIYSGSYQQTIDFFLDNGYTLDQDFFVFPYDWRKDIILTTPLLDQKVDQIRQQTGSQKVDTVAHSMGGLVARNYIADAQRAQKVRKLITLGTPHLGSVEFLKTLRYGTCVLLEVGPFCLTLAPSEAGDVVQNMIGGYELAPSQTYFTFYSGEDNTHPYPYSDLRDIDSDGTTGVLNYGQTKTLLTNLNHNTSLFVPSETFHNLDSILGNTNGVDVTNIVGSGTPTLGQIVEKYSVDFLGIRIPHRDEVPINGDETVPLFSASLIDPSRNISMGSANVFYTKQKHGSLVSDGPALQLVKNVLDDNNALPNGVSTQPYPFSGTRVSVHSPINIYAYDANGNHTGPTPDGFETNIPGSSYDTLGDAKFIWLPNEGQYTIKLEAIDEGTFDFKIKKFENDINMSTVLYNNIPLTNSTKAQTTLDTSSADGPELQLDSDGDDTIDTIVTPSLVVADAASDETPPQTTVALSGIQGSNNWYRSDVTITLTAQDAAGGSGVDKIEYSLDNGQTIETYTGPFTITQEGQVNMKFRSIDRAGNEEIPQEITINIDKTAPEAKIFVDRDQHDLVIEGIDTNPVTVTSAENMYTLTDVAGNTLRLDVRKREKERQDRFRIYSLQYNDSLPTVLGNNHFTVTYQGKKGKVNVKEQNFEIRGGVKIRILYDVRKNQSAIILKEPKKEKVKEVIDGFLLLKLLTDNGNLIIQY